MKPRVAIFIGLLAISSADVARSETYRIRVLAAGAKPVAINNLGEVALNRGPEAFLHSWGILHPIAPLPGGNWIEAFGINDRGQVVGRSESYFNPRAFVYAEERTTPVPVHAIASTATDINNAGQISGDFYGAGFGAFLCDELRFIQIPSLDGGTNYASAVNDRGDVAGRSHFGRVHGPHATVYSSSTGQLTDLGVLGGSKSMARDINERGDVVGSSHVIFPAEYAHGFFYRNGVMYDIGVLANFDRRQSELVAVNGSGIAVGWSDTNGSDRKPVIYADWTLRDINTLLSPGSGWVIRSVFDINDRGEMVGVGFHNGVAKAYALRPVMEPSNVISYLRAVVQRMPIARSLSIELTARLNALDDQMRNGSAAACRVVAALSRTIEAGADKRIRRENAEFLIDGLEDVRIGLECAQ
jgi:probable HAF family extracellular repeat protein